MLLADSIEAWGRAHRGEMSRDELEDLGTVWRTIKTSPFAELDFRSMGKDDARAVMALFEQSRRAGVSQTLNSVRKWAMAQPSTAAGDADDSTTPVTPERTELPGAETVVMRAPTGPAPPAAPAAAPTPVSAGGLDAGGPVAGPPGFAGVPTPPPGPLQAAGSAGAQAADPLSHGPVQGWQPPESATSSDDSNRKVLAVIAAALVALLLIWLLFLRDDDSTPLSTTDGTTQSTDAGSTTAEGSGTTADGGAAVPAFDAGDAGDFCTVARGLEENDPFSDAGIASFGPEFFADSIALFEGFEAIAPGEIQGDIGIVVAQLRQLDALAAQYDYNFFDPALGDALSTLDTTVTDAASERLDAYLLQVCGIDTTAGDGPAAGGDGTDTGAVPGFDDLTDEQIQQFNEVFLAQLNISPELAECLGRELGDLTAAASDPSILNQPVCGTTLLNVVSGLGS